MAKITKQQTWVVMGVMLLALLYIGVFPQATLLAADKYYDYVYTAPTQIEPGQQIDVSVSLLEKGNILSGCDEFGMGIRNSPPTSTYCRSYTYFNAKSLRIYIDGNEVSNAYLYPKVMGEPFTLTTGFSDAGILTSPTFPNINAAFKPYIYNKYVLAQTSLNGTNIFDISFTPDLEPGTHKVEIYYFSETTRWQNDAAYNADYAAMGGISDPYQNKDHNELFNQLISFDVVVKGEETITTTITANQTLGAGGEADEEETAIGTAQPYSPEQLILGINALQLLVGVAGVLVVGYTYFATKPKKR